MRYSLRQHHALTALRSIRTAERYAAQSALIEAVREQAIASEQLERAHGATEMAVDEWDAQLRGPFDPDAASVLAERVSGCVREAETAHDEASLAAGRRAAREDEWHLSDAHTRQSDALLATSRRALARKRETAVLDRQSDLTAQRWSRS